MEKSTNTIANLIIFLREIANLIAHTTIWVHIIDDGYRWHGSSLSPSTGYIINHALMRFSKPHLTIDKINSTWDV